MTEMNNQATKRWAFDSPKQGLHCGIILQENNGKIKFTDL